MAKDDRWYFTQDKMANTPSRKFCLSESKELFYRQQSALFIQDMGQKLKVNSLCINHAITYMHRFYMFHSFSEIHWSELAMAAIFLASKSEEQHRKMEHVIKCACNLLHINEALDVASELYKIKEQELVANENILISTLGFDFLVEHPHPYVIKICETVKAARDLGSMSYLLATTSLQLTTMCLMYSPKTVACVCFYLACKWAQWKIEPCSEGKDWFHYVDPSMTYAKLEDLANKYIKFLEMTPSRFKKKLLEKKAAIYGPSTSKVKSNNTTESTKKDNPSSEKKENTVCKMIPITSMQSSVSGLLSSSSAQLSAKPSASDSLASSVPLSSDSNVPINAEKEYLTFIEGLRLRREQRKHTSSASQVKTQKTHRYNKKSAQEVLTKFDSCNVVEVPTKDQTFPSTKFSKSCLENELPINNMKFECAVKPTKQDAYLPVIEKTVANVEAPVSSLTQLSMASLPCLSKETFFGQPMFDTQKVRAMYLLRRQLRGKKQSIVNANIPVSSSSETSLLRPPSHLFTKPLIAGHLNIANKIMKDKIKPINFVPQGAFPGKGEPLLIEKFAKTMTEASRPGMLPSSLPSISKLTALSMPQISNLEDPVKTSDSLQDDVCSSNHLVYSSNQQDSTQSKGLKISTMKLHHILKSNPENQSSLVKIQQVNDPVHRKEINNVPILPMKIKFSEPVQLYSNKSKTDLGKQLKCHAKIENVLPAIVNNSIPRNQQPFKKGNLEISESIKQEKVNHMGLPVKAKHEISNIYCMGNIPGLKVKIPKELVTFKYIVNKPEISSKANFAHEDNKTKNSGVLKIITTDKSGTYITAPKGDGDKGSRKRPHSDISFDLKNKILFDKHPAKHQKLDHSSSKVKPKCVTNVA